MPQTKKLLALAASAAYPLDDMMGVSIYFIPMELDDTHSLVSLLFGMKS
jgi:hypothetical protein